jgi:hypothetical protein
MKRSSVAGCVVVVLLAAAMLVPSSEAQWVTTGTSSTTPIWYNGLVGAGGAPVASSPECCPLQVNNPGGNAFLKASGSYAGLVVNSPAQFPYCVIDFVNTYTNPVTTWRVGMASSAAFAIIDQRYNVSRLFIDLGGNIQFNGSTNFTGNVAVTGDITATGSVAATYQDVAEWVPIDAPAADGTVVVLDRRRPNAVRPSATSYDTTVAGVVSSTPGIILGEAAASKAKIATTGRVKVAVDAATHPIAIGDLLVTSDKPGFAMKSEPMAINGRSFHQPGTIIGKALEPLSSGEGRILVLLSLQ